MARLTDQLVHCSEGMDRRGKYKKLLESSSISDNSIKVRIFLPFQASPSARGVSSLHCRSPCIIFLLRLSATQTCTMRPFVQLATQFPLIATMATATAIPAIPAMFEKRQFQPQCDPRNGGVDQDDCNVAWLLIPRTTNIAL